MLLSEVNQSTASEGLKRICIIELKAMQEIQTLLGPNGLLWTDETQRLFIVVWLINYLWYHRRMGRLGNLDAFDQTLDKLGSTVTPERTETVVPIMVSIVNICSSGRTGDAGNQSRTFI